MDTGDFTIFVRNYVQFTQFGKYETNLDDKHNNGSLIKGYNLWTIDEIIDIKSVGMIISMNIIWNCDFDKDCECDPEFEFNRVDNTENSIIDEGYYIKTVT